MKNNVQHIYYFVSKNFFSKVFNKYLLHIL